MTRRRRDRVPTRAYVVRSLAVFAVLHLALNVSLELAHPSAYDPEYGDRLAALERLSAADAGRPLLLVVGSSRITTDFRPELLPPLRAADGTEPLPFNFSHSGAGPLLNLLELNRLIRAGHRPRWAVIEVMPPLLPVHGHSTAASLASARDLPLLARHVPTWKLAGLYFWEKLASGYNHRHALVRHLAPGFGPAGTGWDSMPLDPLGGSTRWQGADAGPDEIIRRTAAVRAQYAPGLQRFRIAGSSDRAMRDLLSLCGREGIAAVLLLTPESSEFRGWYPPAAEQLLSRYLDALGREFGVPVVDARAWLAAGDFADGQHAFPSAAAAFTRRLGREVLQPLVAGRPEKFIAPGPP
jgi:hypothetical protein